MDKIKISEQPDKTPTPKVKIFHIGDLAVYPAHGVGRIEAIEQRVVNGETHDFYIMKILENDMVIMIPTWNVDQVGLRDIINEKQVVEVYGVLEQKKSKFAESQTWNRRYREYMEKIKTGSLFDVAEVFRDLSLLKSNKDLSFGERKLYDTAQTLLVRELSTVLKSDETTIVDKLESFFESKSSEDPEDPKDGKDSEESTPPPA